MDGCTHHNIALLSSISCGFTHIVLWIIEDDVTCDWMEGRGGEGRGGEGRQGVEEWRGKSLPPNVKIQYSHSINNFSSTV